MSMQVAREVSPVNAALVRGTLHRLAPVQISPVPATAEALSRLPDEVMTMVTRVAGGRRRVRMGEFLSRAGAAFHNLYVVRVGMFKSVVLDSEGREQVTGFYMAGEALGLDGIEKELCQTNVVALEDSEVWEIPYARLASLMCQDPGMQRLFHRMMSREIQRDYLMMLLLGSMSAEERLAAFLVNLSERLVARGYSATQFVLRMSRREIGSYLGLTIETVSRVFTRFQRTGLIRAESKAVELKDTVRLKTMVGASLVQAA